MMASLTRQCLSAASSSMAGSRDCANRSIPMTALTCISSRGQAATLAQSVNINDGSFCQRVSHMETPDSLTYTACSVQRAATSAIPIEGTCFWKDFGTSQGGTGN